MCNDGHLCGNAQVTVAGGTGRKKDAGGNEHARMDLLYKAAMLPFPWATCS